MLLSLGVHTTSVEAKNSKLKPELNNQTKVENNQTQKTQSLKVDKLGNISLKDVANKNDLNTEISGSNAQIKKAYADGAFKLVKNAEGQKEVKVNLDQLKKSLGVKDKTPTIPENNNGAKRNVETQPPSANTEQPTESKPTQGQSTEIQNPIVPNTTPQTATTKTANSTNPKAPEETIKGGSKWYENSQSILAGLGIATLGGLAWWKKDKIRESTILLAYRAEQEYNKRIKKSKEVLVNLKKSNSIVPQSAFKEESWSIKNIPFNLKNDFGTIKSFITERATKLKGWINGQKKNEKKAKIIHPILEDLTGQFYESYANMSEEEKKLNDLEIPKKILNDQVSRVEDVFERHPGEVYKFSRDDDDQAPETIYEFKSKHNAAIQFYSELEKHETQLNSWMSLDGIQYNSQLQPNLGLLKAERIKQRNIVEFLNQTLISLDNYIKSETDLHMCFAATDEISRIFEYFEPLIVRHAELDVNDVNYDNKLNKVKSFIYSSKIRPQTFPLDIFTKSDFLVNARYLNKTIGTKIKGRFKKEILLRKKVDARFTGEREIMQEILEICNKLNIPYQVDPVEYQIKAKQHKGHAGQIMIEVYDFTLPKKYFTTTTIQKIKDALIQNRRDKLNKLISESNIPDIETTSHSVVEREIVVEPYDPISEIIKIGDFNTESNEALKIMEDNNFRIDDVMSKLRANPEYLRFVQSNTNYESFLAAFEQNYAYKIANPIDNRPRLKLE